LLQGEVQDAVFAIGHLLEDLDAVRKKAIEVSERVAKLNCGLVKDDHHRDIVDEAARLTNVVIDHLGSCGNTIALCKMGLENLAKVIG
jgi:hypothetical protein